MTVTAADLAQALGSGDVPVLGTPRVVALSEAATVAALKGQLPETHTTVGTRIDLRHTAPTAIGAQVVAHARLAEIDNTSLLFEVEVLAGGQTVAKGQVRRALVDREKFLAPLRSR